MKIRKIKRNKPRIALIIDTWFPIHTGEQVYTAKLAVALANEYGYEVDILTRNIAGHRSAEQIEIEKMPAIRVKKFGWKSHPWNLFLQFGYMLWVFLHLIFRGKSYKLYHAQSATSAFAMKAAFWFTRVPTLLTVHSSRVFDRRWTLKKIIHRVMFLETKYSQEISISESFLKATNVNDHVLVVPYGVHTEPFDAVESKRSPQQFNVLYVGRLDRQKGVDVLLKAAQKVIESNGFIQSQKDFMLHIAGEGPDRRAFEKLAENLNIQKYVRFHGLMDGVDLIHLYKMCDLFALPSRGDALPLSVLEACSAKLPILATGTGDLRNVVLENVNGHLVEPDDVDDLAYYIEHFASNPHLEALGEGSYELVVQEYSWEKSMQKMLHIYENLMVEKEVKMARPHEHFLPWEIPSLFWKARGNSKIYKGKAPLRFCFTCNLVGESPEIPAFLEHYAQFCKQLEIPSTLFVQSDLLEPFANQLKTLQEDGHEIGIKPLETQWLTGPMRRSTLREVRDICERVGIKEVRMLKPPLELSEQDLEILHEAGFENIPVSEDPLPHIEFHWAIPFAYIYKMNLRTFMELDEKELLEAVNRLRAYQKKHELSPFLIFECDSIEFTSHENMAYASGENFTLFSKKLAFLRENMELSRMTLSAFCKKCSLGEE